MDKLKWKNDYGWNFEWNDRIQQTSLIKYRNIIIPYLIKQKNHKENNIGVIYSSFSKPAKTPST